MERTHFEVRAECKECWSFWYPIYGQTVADCIRQRNSWSPQKTRRMVNCFEPHRDERRLYYNFLLSGITTGPIAFTTSSMKVTYNVGFLEAHFRWQCWMKNAGLRRSLLQLADTGAACNLIRKPVLSKDIVFDANKRGLYEEEKESLCSYNLFLIFNSALHSVVSCERWREFTIWWNNK